MVLLAKASSCTDSPARASSIASSTAAASSSWPLATDRALTEQDVAVQHHVVAFVDAPEDLGAHRVEQAESRPRRGSPAPGWGSDR